MFDQSLLLGVKPDFCMLDIYVIIFVSQAGDVKEF